MFKALIEGEIFVCAHPYSLVSCGPREMRLIRVMNGDALAFKSNHWCSFHNPVQAHGLFVDFILPIIHQLLGDMGPPFRLSFCSICDNQGNVVAYSDPTCDGKTKWVDDCDFADYSVFCVTTGTQAPVVDYAALSRALQAQKLLSA